MRELCAISDVKNTGLKKILTDGTEVLVVRHDEQVFAYLNLCPHAFAKLDAFGEKFIGLDGHHLMCTVHGALFRPENGYCVAGPCQGQRLSQLPIKLSDGKVWITENSSLNDKNDI